MECGADGVAGRRVSSRLAAADFTYLEDMRTNVTDPAKQIARLIARMALRECALLDELSANRHPVTCLPQIKRRHKQFMSELTMYYCCVCELFLRSNLEGNVQQLVDLTAEEVARAATYDRFIARPPYFISDRVANRIKRYGRYIESGLLRLRSAGSARDLDSLAARTALELRQLVSGELSSTHQLGELEAKLFERLKWTAGELTGQPRS